MDFSQNIISCVCLYLNTLNLRESLNTHRSRTYWVGIFANQDTRLYTKSLYFTNPLALAWWTDRHGHIRGWHRKVSRTIPALQLRCSQHLYLGPLLPCLTASTWSVFALSCSQDAYAATSVFNQFRIRSHMFCFLQSPQYWPFCPVLEKRYRCPLPQSLDVALIQHSFIFIRHLLCAKHS